MLGYCIEFIFFPSIHKSRAVLKSSPLIFSPLPGEEESNLPL